MEEVRAQQRADGDADLLIEVVRRPSGLLSTQKRASRKADPLVLEECGG